MTTKHAEQKVRIADRAITAKTNLVQAMNEIAADLKRVGDAHDKHDDALATALRGGISSANNKLVQYKSVTVDLPADAPWQDLDPAKFYNSWANAGGTYPPLQFLAEPGAHVYMRGSVDSGTAAYLADLPAPEYAPRYDQKWCAVNAAAGAHVDVFQNGAINIGMPGGIYSGTRVDFAMDWIASPAPSLGLLPGRPFAFPAPSWPVIVNHGWDKCLGLVVEGCFEETSGERATYGAPVADWEDIGSGQVSLRGVWGLTWGRRYTLRLRLSAEKE